MIDWTDAYENGAYIPGAADYRARWPVAADAFRKSQTDAALDQPYGPQPRNAYDLFRAPSAKGTVIFVHGGYWHQTDRKTWSHVAAGPLAQGWSVAMPSYTLAPDIRISGITAEIVAAVTQIAADCPGPLRLIGHSAGGHLVSRMACAGVLPDALRKRIVHTVSLSGVHHLTPLLEAQMNDILRLDLPEAKAESPALLDPAPDARICFFTGAAERPEFLRQARMIGETWGLKGAKVSETYAPGENHFSVVEMLADPASALCAELCQPID